MQLETPLSYERIRARIRRGTCCSARDYHSIARVQMCPEGLANRCSRVSQRERLVGLLRCYRADGSLERREQVSRRKYFNMSWFGAKHTALDGQPQDLLWGEGSVEIWYNYWVISVIGVCGQWQTHSIQHRDEDVQTEGTTVERGPFIKGQHQQVFVLSHVYPGGKEEMTQWAETGQVDYNNKSIRVETLETGEVGMDDWKEGYGSYLKVAVMQHHKDADCHESSNNMNCNWFHLEWMKVNILTIYLVFCCIFHRCLELWKSPHVCLNPAYLSFNLWTLNNSTVVFFLLLFSFCCCCSSSSHFWQVAMPFLVEYHHLLYRSM